MCGFKGCAGFGVGGILADGTSVHPPPGPGPGLSAENLELILRKKTISSKLYGSVKFRLMGCDLNPKKRRKRRVA